MKHQCLEIVNINGFLQVLDAQSVGEILSSAQSKTQFFLEKKKKSNYQKSD